jgi:hypothetical protein
MTDVTPALSILAFLSLGVLVGSVTYLSARPVTGLALPTTATWGVALVVAVVGVVAVTVWADRNWA